MRVNIDAPAKINLFLDIRGKRNDGYHIVSMVLQSVSLHDEITVSDTDDSEISIVCSDESVPLGENNTVYKAAKLFFEETKIENKGVEIKIKKNIPMEAGLAGGSTDAAAVLLAMNKIFDTELSKKELADIGADVGADVPFCVYGGTMTAGGIGTILSPLPDLPECYFVIVKPKVGVSTKEAYEKSDSPEFEAIKGMDKITEAICEANIKSVAKNLYNKFEVVTDLPEVEAIKSFMLQYGALGAAMTGSGSAVFGIFDNDNERDDCARKLEEQYDTVFTAEPVSELSV